MKKNRSFKKQLIYSFLTVTLISILFLGTFQIIQISSLVKESQKTQTQTTKFFAEYVMNYVEEHKKVIETQAIDLQTLMIANDNGEVLQQLKNVKENYSGFINLYLADSNGKAILFYPEVNNEELNFSDRSYFKKLKEEEDTIISSVFQGKGGTNKQLITIATPIFNKQGQMEKYLLGALDLTALKERIHSQGFGTEGFPVVLDQNNNAIVHPDVDTGRDIVTFDDSDIVKYINEQYSDNGANYFTKTQSDGKDYITYKKLSNLGWTVWLEKPASVFSNTYKNSILTVVSFLLITALIMIGISIVLSNRIEKAITSLLNYIKSYTMGAVDDRPIAEIVQGPEEMEELSTYFSSMIGEVEQNKQDLMKLNTDLEKKVHERTANLEIKNLELNVLNNLITSVLSEKDVPLFIQRCLQEIDQFKSYPIHVLFRGQAISSNEILEKDAYEYMRENTESIQQRIEPKEVGKKDESFLVVELDEGKSIKQEEHDFLQAFVSSLAIMLQNKFLFNRYRNKHAELEAILESMSEGLMLLNNEQQVEYVNEFFMNVVSVGNENKVEISMLSDLYSRLVHLFDVDPERLTEFFNNNEDQLKLKYKSESGKAVFYLLHKFSVRLDEDKIGEGLLLHDITKEEEIDTLKNNLISLTSHEFKTPITTIKGSVETLLRSEVEWEPEFQQELLEGVHEDIERIQHLVDDWMDISKIESGTMYVDRNMIRSDHVVEGALDQIPQELREDASFEFINNIDEYLFFYADKERVQQVLINLFTNALRYSDEKNKKIHIKLDKVEDYMTISVSDNGIGISADHIDRIFNRFYQVDATATRRRGGTGLGLAICKGIMEAHEGKIEVDSVEGKGSVFTLYFPLRGGE